MNQIDREEQREKETKTIKNRYYYKIKYIFEEMK